MVSVRRQSVVRLLAAVATVMHLTCGCCLHAAHAGDGRHGDHGGCGVVADAPAHSGCADHGCDAEATPTVADVLAPRVVATAAEGDGHECRGCRCVADATGNDVAASWRPLACGVTAAIDARLIIAASAATACAADDGGPPVIPERHPLRERLIV